MVTLAFVVIEQSTENRNPSTNRSEGQHEDPRPRQQEQQVNGQEMSTDIQPTGVVTRRSKENLVAQEREKHGPRIFVVRVRWVLNISGAWDVRVEDYSKQVRWEGPLDGCGAIAEKLAPEGILQPSYFWAWIEQLPQGKRIQIEAEAETTEKWWKLADSTGTIRMQELPAILKLGER